mmetsp:Transcript_84715/g.263548  ORF Transcript_84715/g.263548 Transcript_84715/m.263548 type:complete len:246 (-) Transcript_84715:741-1478(-)
MASTRMPQLHSVAVRSPGSCRGHCGNEHCPHSRPKPMALRWTQRTRARGLAATGCCVRSAPGLGLQVHGAPHLVELRRDLVPCLLTRLEQGQCQLAVCAGCEEVVDTSAAFSSLEHPVEVQLYRPGTVKVDQHGGRLPQVVLPAGTGLTGQRHYVQVARLVALDDSLPARLGHGRLQGVEVAVLEALAQEAGHGLQVRGPGHDHHLHLMGGVVQLDQGLQPRELQLHVLKHLYVVVPQGPEVLQH